MTRLAFILPFLFLAPVPLVAFDPVYDEENVPDYTLPDPLVFENGDPVKTEDDWAARRDELLRLFEKNVYGRAPLGKPEDMHFETLTPTSPFEDTGGAITEVRIHFTGNREGPFLDLLILAPASPEPVPAVLALNFDGNHTVHPNTAISLPESWMRDRLNRQVEGAVVDNRATEKGRGAKSSRWPVRKILDSGVALATFYHGDVDPDFDDGFENGVHSLAERPSPEQWGTISAWAWGARRAMDYLETHDGIDSERVAVMGHSRLGKTALWAGAQDTRFRLVISNNSGCGGATLSRRRFGERVSRINSSFPHWFCDRFNRYNENESELPVDQHQLIALVAPRWVYIASAKEDRWADPRGEFLAARAASPVWEFLGHEGLEVESMPDLNQPVGQRVRYHIRTGEHDVTDYDWEQYLEVIGQLVP